MQFTICSKCKFAKMIIVEYSDMLSSETSMEENDSNQNNFNNMLKIIFDDYQNKLKRSKIQRSK